MRKTDNLPPSCAVVTKSGNLNFLEPSGPVQACNETALLYLLIYIFTSIYLCIRGFNYIIMLHRISDYVVSNGRTGE